MRTVRALQYGGIIPAAAALVFHWPAWMFVVALGVHVAGDTLFYFIRKDCR